MFSMYKLEDLQHMCISDMIMLQDLALEWLPQLQSPVILAKTQIRIFTRLLFVYLTLLLLASRSQRSFN